MEKDVENEMEKDDEKEGWRTKLANDPNDEVKKHQMHRACVWECL